MDIISRYTKLTKLGPGYAGVCPFCGATGKTDFLVSAQYQKYTCSKCSASGGIFQFLQTFKDISLEEALDEVKETFGIPLKAHFLDSRWNEVLRGTDFQRMLNRYAKKSAPILGGSDLTEREHANIEEPISYTALATFIRCPLEYKLRYRDKIKVYEPAGTHVNLGRFLHSVASQFLREPLENRNARFIEMKFKTETDTSTNAEYVDELRRFKEPTTMLLLENFADSYLSDKNPHFRTQFGSFTLVGTADCLIESSDGTEIIEFKEYDYRDFEDASEVLHYLQLLFYYFGLQEEGADISGGAYCFFNDGYMDHVTFSKEIIEGARTSLEQKLQELAECKVFIPKLSRLCTSCGYKDKCELHRQVKAKGVAQI